MREGATVMGDFFEEVLDPARSAERKSHVARKPWWQLAKTVRQGFWMSAAYLVLAIGGLIGWLTVPSSALPEMFTVLWLVFSACYLASTVGLRRRLQRTRQQPGTTPMD